MIQISEKYAIDFDKLNVILVEKYEKRDGKGKNAPLSGEFAYREIGYHGSFKSLVNQVVEYGIRDDTLSELNEIVERIDNLKAEIEKLLNSTIDIEEEKRKYEASRKRKE